MGTANGLIARARQDLGMREPNSIQRWYAGRNGSAFNYNFPWCAAAVVKWAVDSGNYDAVCFGVDDAYTVTYARRAVSKGRWRWGTSGIKAGDIAFIDWTGKDSIAYIDHVGVVTGTSSTSVRMIEGNRGDRCSEQWNSRGLIVGYIRPDYNGQGTPIRPGTPTNALDDLLMKLPTIKRGSKNKYVGKWQGLLCACGINVSIDDDFGPKTEAATKRLQETRKIRNSVSNGKGDGIVGTYTWESGIVV